MASSKKETQTAKIVSVLGFSAYSVRVFWSVFFRIRTEYKDVLCKSPYSVQMQEDVDQKNSEYGHFLLSDLTSTL